MAVAHIKLWCTKVK